MTDKTTEIKIQRVALSIDGWAVAIALGLAVLVRAGLLKHIPW